MVLTALTSRVNRAANRPSVLERCRQFSARGRVRYQTWRECGRHYAAPMEPFRVHWVDPDSITHTLTYEDRRALEATDVSADADTDLDVGVRTDVDASLDAGIDTTTASPQIQSVSGGEWDLDAPRFDETRLYRSLRDRFLEGKPWEETAYTEVVARENRRRREDSRQSWHGIDTQTDLQARYAFLDGLYQSIATEGYRPAEERRPTDHDPLLPPAKSEICVAVGRDGQFTLADGRHRLAIARVLGLESVPIHILRRHERWQARRDRLVLTGRGGGNHPDLVGLSPSALALE